MGNESDIDMEKQEWGGEVKTTIDPQESEKSQVSRAS